MRLLKHEGKPETELDRSLNETDQTMSRLALCVNKLWVVSG
jgi:hypothetical protein